MSQWSWIGHTQAGRELRLFGEEGGGVDGAEIDGERIELKRGRLQGGRELGDGFLVKSDAGTFTAIRPSANERVTSCHFGESGGRPPSANARRRDVAADTASVTNGGPRARAARSRAPECPRTIVSETPGVRVAICVWEPFPLEDYEPSPIPT